MVSKMGETTKPKPGEWWRYNGVRVRIVGTLINGNLVCEYRDGKTATLIQGDWWYHEPGCDSFDWVEPPAIDPGEGHELLAKGTMLEEGDEYQELCRWDFTGHAGDIIGGARTPGPYRRKIKPPAEVWPKWYRWNSDIDMTFRVGNDKQYIGYWKDREVSLGTWNDDLLDAVTKGDMLEVTEAEALARIAAVTPEQLATASAAWQAACETMDGPDDWVELPQNHVLRKDIDQVQHKSGDWVPVAGLDGLTTSTMKIRCRRKDLPVPVPVPPAVKRLPVRLWISEASGAVFESSRMILAGDREILHDADGFYVEVTE